MFESPSIRLSVQLAKNLWGDRFEVLVRPILSYNDVKFFFEKLMTGDADDYSYRIALVDALVDRIYLFDGDDARIEIYCKASNHVTMQPLGGVWIATPPSEARNDSSSEITAQTNSDGSVAIDYYKNCAINEQNSSYIAQLARQRRFELPTFWSVARRSIQLSYWRTLPTEYTIPYLKKQVLFFNNH